MVVANEPADVAGEPKASVTRAAKTIKPIDATLKAPEADGEADTPADAEPDAGAASESAPEAAEDGTKTETEQADADAEAEAAKAAREAELEKLIESGKYAVPINAVQRKRSRMYVTLLCLLALVLAAVLLDAGVLKIHGIKPLTHFFGS